MKLNFTITPLKFDTVQELANAWSNNDYIALLEKMEYGDTSEIPEAELKEMCLMALSDSEPDEAAKNVLNHIFGDRLNKGQIDNLSHEMMDEKMWEEYADLSLHEEFFNANQLLYEAYNGKFPHPEAVRFQIRIQAREKAGMAIFEKDTEAALIRLLVQGMPDGTIISRLFEEQLKGAQFADAKDIIWQFKKEREQENALLFTIVSSSYWFHDLKYTKMFAAELTYLG